MGHTEPTVTPQMEGANMSLSPLPPTPSFPSSPSSPRKRSIHEVDGASLSSSEAKRALTTFTGENQENRDPTQLVPNKETTSPKDTQTVRSLPTPQVVITSKPSVSPRTPMDVDTPVQNNGDQTDASTGKSEPASKKPKLGPTAKEAKQQEKELKERQRLEEKAKKEEEKRLREEEKKKKDAEREEEKRLKEEEKKKRDAERDEEKRHKEEEKKKRDAEREEKKKAKEAEKAAKEAAKEDERRQKEEAKQKKERAQPKLNSFFAKPQPPASPAKTALPSQTGTSPNSKAIASQLPISDYAKAFPEFFLQSHTTVAPLHRFERDTDALAHVRFTIDTHLTTGDSQFQLPPFRPSEIFHMIPFHRRRGRKSRPVRDILRRMQPQDDNLTLPGTDQSGDSLKAAMKELTEIRMKSLKFGEDVRPAYQGTFTPEVSEDMAAKICRNPYLRGLPTLNYDYDSEAEWEEPEEGEDLDSEEEEEGSDDGEDDMEGFLDDEDDALAGGKRRPLVGDLEPVCSGIHWAADGEIEELEQYRMQALLPVQFPIDPFSSAYWEKPSTTTNQPTKKNIFASDAKTNGAPKATIGLSMRPPPPPATKAKRPFPPELMEDFKGVVEGNDMSKIGLIEILKKRFPKVSKETLKVTLDQVAVRVGQKEADKTWTCR